MKRPVGVIVGIAAGLLLVAGAGASAHTALHLLSSGTSAGNVLSEDASVPRTESPEPSESPEAPATAEPTEKPEPTEAPETEAPDNDANDDQGEHDNHQGSGQHHEGDDGGSDD